MNIFLFYSIILLYSNLFKSYCWYIDVNNLASKHRWMRCWGVIQFLDEKELSTDVIVLSYFILILLFISFILSSFEMVHRTHIYFFILFIYTSSIDVKCLSVVISSQDGEGPSTDVIVLNDFIYSFWVLGWYTEPCLKCVGGCIFSIFLLRVGLFTLYVHGLLNGPGQVVFLPAYNFKILNCCILAYCCSDVQKFELGPSSVP